ncbi:NADP-dependent oxidoreductase [Jatrophihabitans sp. DSM 45814]
MKAIGLWQFGGPEVLEEIDLPEPHAGPGQVRIRVQAAAVNPTDTGFRAGVSAKELASLERPYVPGMDAAGVIDEVGDGADWQLGDKVMAIVRPFIALRGAYAEQIVVPSESVARAPANCDFISAATLPMNGLTARMALDMLALAPGQILGVTGAAGTLGSYVIQMAKAEGLQVIADSSEADEELVRGLGADHIVRRGPGVGELMRGIVPDGVDGLADGAVMDAAIVPAIKDGGGLAVVRGWGGEPGRNITTHNVRVRNYATEQKRLDGLRQQVEDGVITLRVARTYPAKQAAEAHRQLEAGGTRGRIVLEF